MKTGILHRRQRMRLRRVVPWLLAFLLAFGSGAVLHVPVASAETFVIDQGPPKGVVGYDGIRCTGEYERDGNTYRYVMYFGADEHEAQESERSWQESRCHQKMQRVMVAW